MKPTMRLACGMTTAIPQRGFGGLPWPMAPLRCAAAVGASATLLLASNEDVLKSLNN